MTEEIKTMPTGLYWQGKKTEVDRIVLPFQTIETINESRATREKEKKTGADMFKEEANANWHNRLIWGDNKYVMASLLPEFAGKIDLIYIDPPFATGADFSVKMEIGDASWTKEPSAIEDKAYRDTWGRGLDSYLQMMYERLVLMRELLSENASIYVHVGPNVSHYIKVVLDDVFGMDNYHSEIVWRRSNSHNKLTDQYGPIHDVIFFFSKTSAFTFHPTTRPFSRGYIEERFKYRDNHGIYQPNYLTGPGTRKGESGMPWHGFDPTRVGRHWAIPAKLRELLNIDTSAMTTQEILDECLKAELLVIPKKEGGQPMYRQYLNEGVPHQDVWAYQPNTKGVLYGTDECIDEDVKWLEQEEEKLGYETQKPEGLIQRIIETSTDSDSLVADFFCGSGTTGAVAEKLGRRWIMADLGRFAIHTTRKRLLGIEGCKPFVVQNLGKYERQYWQGVTFKKRSDEQIPLYEYIEFILKLYKAEPLAGMLHLHGRKGKRLIHIGAVDAPVTFAEIQEAIAETKKAGQDSLDILGWEWEMGLHDVVEKAAKASGVHLRLFSIPRDVMDDRAVEKGEITFYELAYLDVEAQQDKAGRFVVALKDFAIPNLDLIPPEVRKVIKKWSDYIDYWAVDWDWNEDTFHNMWQSYRTRKERKLELKSDPHAYETKGKHLIMVKVIDIFGNDTTKVLEVKA